MDTLSVLAEQLEAGRIKSRDLVEQCLEKAGDPNGEGARVYIHVDAEQARVDADAIDKLRAEGKAPTPYSGIPISVKDLFDIEGEVTRAGSKLLANHDPAREDAEIVKRLYDAGLVIIGRTNMTEFAYSGLGLNPHYGTPLNPFERDKGRIPGGSSSGAAVSVTDGMAAAGIGTDTGGSCRIPAAFCGLVGYKPTASRIPLTGAFPLSNSFDSIGPLARSVACCHALDAIMAGESHNKKLPISADDMRLDYLRLGVLQNYVMENIEPEVAAAYENALSRLAQAGATLEDFTLPLLDELPDLNARGGIVAAEAYQFHRTWLLKREDEYDPRVSVRMKKAMEQEPDEYKNLLKRREAMIAKANVATSKLDAVIFPTTPIIAPLLSMFEDESTYGRMNLLALRNPTVTNFLDRCAISLPIHEAGTAPVGLMIMGRSMGDDKLFAISAAVEKILQRNG